MYETYLSSYVFLPLTFHVIHTKLEIAVIQSDINFSFSLKYFLESII